MKEIADYISQLISSFNKSISNGFDIYETIISVFFLSALVLVIWILAWMIIKVSVSFFDTVRVLIGALENVLNSFFGGLKKVLKKIGEFGKDDD